MATSLPKQGFTSSILVRIALNLVPWNHPRAMVLTWANHHQVLSRCRIREFWGQSHFGIKVISNVEHAKWCIINIYIYMCVYMIYCNTMYVYYVSTGSCISNVSTMLSSQHLSITLSNLGTFLGSKIWRKKRHDVSGNCRILKWRYCTI
jgi:hypothetical protein